MRNVTVHPSDDTDGQVFIGCIGYESRSIAALEEFVSYASKDARIILFDYATPEASYLANKCFVSKLNCDIYSNFDEFTIVLKSLFQASHDRSTLDITSFDRSKLAEVLQIYFAAGNQLSSLTLVYYPQVFKQPGKFLEDVTSFGPVTPAFIGISEPEKLGIKLILGAGFEYGRAVSAIDLLEPAETHCYVPLGADDRFEETIRENNLDFSFLSPQDQLIPYYISEPNSLFFELMSAISAFSGNGNVIILPLGPKIFAAVSLVAALCYHPNVMVWRHSVNPKRDDEHRDAVASGQRVTFTISLV